MKKQGFTLAEVLITLAIIGVVAAISIPSVVANTQQKEFQTGLRKAVSVLNSSITMNMAIDGESPYENGDLYSYLGRHMSILRTNCFTPFTKELYVSQVTGIPYSNIAFYTTDGMRFEFMENFGAYDKNYKLHEDPSIRLRGTYTSSNDNDYEKGTFKSHNSICTKNGSSRQNCSYCGSYGLNSNTDNTLATPCLVVVDVNGDRKPFPKNASCFTNSCRADNVRKYADIDGLKLTDSFTIMITDKQAIPYGVAAQRAMYQAQKSK